MHKADSKLVLQYLNYELAYVGIHAKNGSIVCDIDINNSESGIFDEIYDNRSTLANRKATDEEISKKRGASLVAVLKSGKNALLPREKVSEETFNQIIDKNEIVLENSDSNNLCVQMQNIETVSYTHLTLPTIYSV